VLDTLGLHRIEGARLTAGRRYTAVQPQGRTPETADLQRRLEAGAPPDDEPHALLQTVITQLMKMLTRRGVLIEDMGQTCLAEPDDNGEEARTRPLQAAAITCRIAYGPPAWSSSRTASRATASRGCSMPWWPWAAAEHRPG
jgi:hypothetical protein